MRRLFGSKRKEVRGVSCLLCARVSRWDGAGRTKMVGCRVVVREVVELLGLGGFAEEELEGAEDIVFGGCE